MYKRVSSILVSGALLAPVLSFASPAPSEVLSRSWQPFVEIAGEGDTMSAISEMREMVSLQNTVYENTRFEKETQQFVDGFWASIESFDLKKLYKLLPQQQGDWRQLRVYGTRDGDTYRMGPDPKKLDMDSRDQIQSMGDMAALIQAREVETDGQINYLINSQLSMGLSEVSWLSVNEATSQTLNLVVNDEPALEKGSARAYKDRVRKMNSALSAADVEILAPLWASFPAMWDMVARLGQVERVTVEGKKGSGYKQLQVSFVLKKEQMKKYYPSLGAYLASLGNLMKVNMDVSDSNGRLFAITADSETLRGTLDAYIGDGRILPVVNGKVIRNAKLPKEGQPWNLTARVNSTMHFLGSETHISGAEANVVYKDTGEGVVINSSVTKVPAIELGGNLLIKTGMAVFNALSPVDLEELITEFIGTAVHGNGGKGVTADLAFVEGDVGEVSRVNMSATFEGVNSLMVSIGMGIFTDMLLPNDDESRDMDKLTYDMQTAFASDLENFAKATSAGKKVVAR